MDEDYVRPALEDAAHRLVGWGDAHLTRACPSSLIMFGAVDVLGKDWPHEVINDEVVTQPRHIDRAWGVPETLEDNALPSIFGTRQYGPAW